MFLTLVPQRGNSCLLAERLITEPDFCGAHDWVRFYIEPLGWLYADPSYGLAAVRAGDEERRRFYFGNIDPFRMTANQAFQAPLRWKRDTGGRILTTTRWESWRRRSGGFDTRNLSVARKCCCAGRSDLLEFRKRIEEKKENLVADLAGCIRIPSVYAEDGSGYPYGKKVQECLEYMLETAARLGFPVHNMDNQLGWCEYGEGEEMIAVLCHLDVVPEGDGWTVPPYEGLVRDGRIYGREPWMTKGPPWRRFTALALKEAGVPLKRRIRLLFGLNEETGSADMKYYLKHGGEVPVMGVTPDGEYPVINGEKGLINEVFFRQLPPGGRRPSGRDPGRRGPQYRACRGACEASVLSGDGARNRGDERRPDCH